MLDKSYWISGESIERCPVFRKKFELSKKTVSANLEITALGVYVAELNGKRVGNFRLAPGWTVYEHRVQVQKYDVTSLLECSNELCVTVGNGWFLSRMSHWLHPENKTPTFIARLEVEYSDGGKECFCTDESWLVSESKTAYSDIYDGEHYDAAYLSDSHASAVIRTDISKDILVPQQGENIVVTDILYPSKRFITPKGEYVIDFGQEIAGTLYMEFDAHKGDIVKISCAEMLDADGNFYNLNYRTAKSEMIYSCTDGHQSWEPEFTFFGFRYIKIDGLAKMSGEFRALAFSSDIKRSGWLSSGNQLLNRLCENAIWGQKGNFIDVPTDCPQRNERYGWTGDAQVFINTACWQFDTKKFFEKWLDDVMLEQRSTGAIPNFIPDISASHGKNDIKSSAAWGDAATICPWELYRHYGDRELLRHHFKMMSSWIDYIESSTTTENLWTGGEHFGDWLGLDAEEGSYTGSSDKDLIASAFYYHSVMLTLKANKVIFGDNEVLAEKARNIRSAFIAKYNSFDTQTECALALCFDLADNRVATAEKLVKLIKERNYHLTTGFVGTPYLLYALSENGYTDIAYTLLLQDTFPSWLFSVKNGATTMWEHWDGKKEDGSFWSEDMNSFNHYAYGAFASWLFEEAAGIKPLKAGFEEILIEPKPDKRLGHLTARHNTSYGEIASSWSYETDGRVRYEINVPTKAEIHIRGDIYRVSAGSYTF